MASSSLFYKDYKGKYSLERIRLVPFFIRIGDLLLNQKGGVIFMSRYLEDYEDAYDQSDFFFIQLDSTTISIISWDLLMVEQIFFSPANETKLS